MESKLETSIKRVRGGISIAMTDKLYYPDWQPSDTYIYVGGDDPFCYTEVRYDTWWLASPDYSAHCIAEMNKLSCILIRYVDEEDKVEFAQVKRVIRCLGIKHTVHDIKRQRSGWRRVWYGNESRYEMPHIYGTPIVAIMEGGKETYINAFAIEYGLVYYAQNKVFRGLIDINGDRTDVPFHYFRISTRGDPDIRRDPGTETRSLRNVRGSRCDELIAVEKCRGIGCPPQETKGVPIVVGHWGSGGLPCSKKPTPLPELYYGHERLVIDDQTQSWWVSIFSSIFRGIAQLVADMIKSIMGTDWQSKILTKIVVYYATYMVTKNNLVSCIVTVAVFIANFV